MGNQAKTSSVAFAVVAGIVLESTVNRVIIAPAG